MPKKLSIASGIARGAAAFWNSYQQAKMFEFQEKLAKNKPVIDLLIQQAGDDNTPYKQRAQIIDMLPGLMGAKPDRSLSSILGLDKFNEEDFTVQEAKNVSKGIVGERNTSIPVSGPGIAEGTSTELNQSAQETFGVDPAIVMKKGDLTPADLKKKHIIDIDKAKDENDIAKQARIMELNNELQMRSLKALGFNTVLSKGFNVETGDYETIVANSAGDTRTINLGKHVPDSIKKELIKSNKPPAGKFGQLAIANKIVAEYEVDNSSHSFTDYKTAKQILDDFEKTGQVKEAQIENLRQTISGTRPITPAQAEDDERANTQMRISLESNLDLIRSKAIESSHAAKSSADIAHEQANMVQQLKDELATLEPDSEEYTKLKNAIRVEQRNYLNLKSKADEEKAKDEQNKELLKSAEQRVSSFNSSRGSSSSDVAKYKNLIDAFRSRNQEKTQGLTDEQIVQILRNANKIK